MSPVDRTAFSVAEPEALAATLVEVGLDLPPGLVEEILDRGEAMVAPLSRLLLEARYWETNGARDPQVWAPVHALYLLGALGTVGAIPPILALLREDPGSNLLTDAIPAALGGYGGAAVEALVDFIRDRSVEAVLRASVAAEALLEIGQGKPEFRPKIAREIVLLLRSPGESRGFKSWLALTAASVEDSSVEAAIKACFEDGQTVRDIVDYGVIREMRANRTADTPWAGLDKGQDPMDHFRKESLMALAKWWASRTDLPTAQRRLWRSAPVLEAALLADEARRPKRVPQEEPREAERVARPELEMRRRRRRQAKLALPSRSTRVERLRGFENRKRDRARKRLMPKRQGPV